MFPKQKNTIMEATQTRKDVYAIATEKIIAHLENGTVPWRKPWTDAGIPQNFISRKPYRGINLWLLNMCGYSRNLFLTFKQVKELGGVVQKFEKAHPVLFWKWIKKDKNDKRKIEELTSKDLKPILRYYTVFNIDQCTGLPLEDIPALAKPNKPLLACEAILDGMPSPPQILHKIHQACYYPQTDIINMPKMETFETSESYYATLFHELVHSTGHPTRLNRKEVTEEILFGSEQYSIEELTAEIGASYLSSHASIVMDDFAGNASYIQGWLKVLRGDRKFIVYASAQAQKAVELILGNTL
jgi:antirestriction protein ArdC